MSDSEFKSKAKNVTISGPGLYGVITQKKIDRARNIPTPPPTPRKALLDSDKTPVNLHTLDLLMEKIIQMSAQHSLKAFAIVAIPQEGPVLGGARVIDSVDGTNKLMKGLDEVASIISNTLVDEYSFVLKRGDDE